MWAQPTSILPGLPAVGCRSSAKLLPTSLDERMDKQGRRSFGLALKTRQCWGVFGDILGQEVESNKPPELQILGLIDGTHPSAAQLLQDAVMRDASGRSSA
jgi:hypothetical protein